MELQDGLCRLEESMSCPEAHEEVSLVGSIAMGFGSLRVADAAVWEVSFIGFEDCAVDIIRS